MNIKTTGRTLCVILHYGCEDDTNRCIESLISEKNLFIIISDNDPSQSYDPPNQVRNFVRVIRTGGAAGFSEGNNIGVDAFLTAEHDSVFILNNDTILTEGAFEYLRETLFTDGVGAVGPCMPYASAPDEIWACGGYINKLKLAIGGLQPLQESAYEVDYLPGAAILCHAALWRDIGGLNEVYFLAYEEAEFAMEVRKRGFKVMADPRSIIFHKVGMSSQPRPEYFYNDIRNRLIFSRYLYGRGKGTMYGILILFITSLKARTLKSVYLRIRLWVKAVSDDMHRVPIDRQVLQSVARQLGAYLDEKKY